MAPYLESEAALDEFLRGFEDGTFPKAEWTHQAHVAMAGCYLLALHYPEAVLRIRTGIPKYNVAQGGENTETSGYHETLTIFWILVIRGFLRELPQEMTRLEKVRLLAAEFGGKRRLHEEYYGFDVVNSVTARRGWIMPDLRNVL